MKKLFTKYYQTNEWGSLETPSGPGSDLAHTDTIREVIPEIIDKFKIESILDAPCGDYHWFKEIKRTIPYIGMDVVEPLIKSNIEKYTDEMTIFLCGDITVDQLLTVDLVICRDCLIHFSNKNIRMFIDNFLRSQSKYLLTTNCGIGPNGDIETGQFRFLNLHAEPFNFGLPLVVIPEWQWGGFPPKTLNLYARESIK